MGRKDPNKNLEMEHVKYSIAWALCHYQPALSFFNDDDVQFRELLANYCEIYIHGAILNRVQGFRSFWIWVLKFYAAEHVSNF